jgi:VWFA-related protein
MLLLGQAPRRPPTFSSAAEIVRLDVLAVDHAARLGELTADHFEVRDNGVLQKVRVSRAASVRWEIVVLFDISESVKGPKLEAFRACARAVAASLRSDDHAVLVTFSDVVELRSTTASALPLLAALDDVRPGGSTALFDALFAAIAMPGRTSARPLVILFTDGRDNVSWLSADDVLAAARLADAPIYAVSTSRIGSPSRSPAAPPTWASVAATADDDFLLRITRETGGRLLRADSVASLQAQLASALDEIGGRYIITYEPTGVAKGGWHKVQVRLRHAKGAVVVRPGYFMPSTLATRP